MHLGAIGVRSKHLRFFSSALARLCPGGEARITHVCGFDAPELLPELPEFHRCATPEELVGQVDAVLVLLREGYLHAAPAELAMAQGKPVFVDKPFTCDVGQALALAQRSAETGVPCTGGSTICFTPLVQELAQHLPPCREYVLSYQADPFSPFGGWYFYGSHLTDLCVTLFGGGFTGVHAECHGGRVTAQVAYPSFTVTLRSDPEVQPPVLLAGRTYVLDDRGCYLAGMAHFLAAAKKETPGCAGRLVSSVKLMQAILDDLRGAG